MEQKRRSILVVVSLACVVLLSQYSWNFFYNYNEQKKEIQTYELSNAYINGQTMNLSGETITFSPDMIFESNSRQSSAISVIFGPADKLKDFIFNETIRVMLNGSLSENIKLVLPVYLGIHAVFFILLFFMLRGDKRMNLIWLFLVLLVTGILYLIGVMIAYILKEKQVVEFLRYMGVVVVPFSVALSYLFAASLSEQLKRVRRYIIISSIVIFCAFLFIAFPLSVWNNAYFHIKTVADKPSVVENVRNSYAKTLAPYVKENGRTLVIDGKAWNADNKWSLPFLLPAMQFYLLPSYTSQYPLSYDDKTNKIKNTFKDLQDYIVSERIDRVILVRPDNAIWEAFGLGLAKDTVHSMVVYDCVVKDKTIKCVLNTSFN